MSINKSLLITKSVLKEQPNQKMWAVMDDMFESVKNQLIPSES